MNFERKPQEPPAPVIVWPPKCSNCIYWNPIEPSLVPVNAPFNRRGEALFKRLRGYAIGRCQVEAPSVGDEKWPWTYDVEWCGKYDDTVALNPLAIAGPMPLIPREDL